MPSRPVAMIFSSVVMIASIFIIEVSWFNAVCYVSNESLWFSIVSFIVFKFGILVFIKHCLQYSTKCQGLPGILLFFSY